MARYMIQASYSTQGIADLVSNPPRPGRRGSASG